MTSVPRHGDCTGRLARTLLVLAVVALLGAAIGAIQLLRGGPPASSAQPPASTGAASSASTAVASPAKLGRDRAHRFAGRVDDPDAVGHREEGDARPPPRPPVGTSAKKGVSTWNFSGASGADQDVKRRLVLQLVRRPTNGAVPPASSSSR